MLALVLMNVLVFTACGRQQDSGYITDESTIPHEVGTLAVLPQETTPIVTVAPPMEPSMQALLLQDLDYLLHLFEETYDYINVLYRVNGVHLSTLVENARTVISGYPYSFERFSLEEIPELDYQIFWAILLGEVFLHLSDFAHTELPDMQRFMELSTLHGGGTPRALLVQETFSNSTSIQFYRDLENVFRGQGQNASAFMGLIDYYFSQFFAGHSEEHMAMPVNSNAIVETEILEAGRIAYLHIPSFMINVGAFNMAYRYPLIEFYQEIQGYDHLIIDLRGNIGGFAAFPIMAAMLPLSPDPDSLPDMPIYVLYTGGGRTFGQLELDNLNLPWLHPEVAPQDTALVTLQEILDSGSLVYLHENDWQRFTYGYRVNYSALALRDTYSQFLALPNTPFHGQIWLLTCRWNYSGSAIFARYVKYTGFATLVGETVTGGYALANAIPHALPNSGIVATWDMGFLTDPYGRAFNEHRTQPHYFTREGMDALETVLAMIEEGLY